MCGISAEEAPDPGDNMVLCTNYEEVFSKVISGNVSERRVLDAWASLIYAYHPFPDKKNETCQCTLRERDNLIDPLTI
jgi:hypothetical protein